MSAKRRAILYITRKKGKTILLLLCFFVILVLISTALEINSASEISGANLRKAFKGYFKVAASPEAETEISIDEDFVSSVMALGGLKSYNAQRSCYMTVPKLVLKPGRFTAEGSTKARMTTLISNTDSSRNSYFMMDMLTLSEGHHISENSSEAALISRTLADQNGLKIGDTISAVITEDVTGDADIRGQEFSFQIEGIFEEKEIFQTEENAPECTLVSNYIFIDQSSGNKIRTLLDGGHPQGYEGSVTFFVDDPEEMNQIVNKLKESMGDAAGSLEITENNSAYEQAMIPLKKLSSMTEVMTVVIAVIGCGIISLLLLLWERDRIHEIGLLMSVGIKKSGIFFQQFMECGLIFAAAFLLAVIVSFPAARQIGSVLYHNTVAEAKEDMGSPDAYEAYQNRYNQTAALEAEPEFEVNLSGWALAGLGGIGLVLVIVSVTVSFAAAARKKPKELLIIME